MIISAPRLFLGREFAGAGAVRIADGRVVEILPGQMEADIQLTHGFLSPGLIDLHNNGAFGVDCATASPTAWDQYVDGLAACGVTGVMATIITAPLAEIHAAAASVAAAMARHGEILGLHLEGPFLSPRRLGAHRAEWRRDPEAALIEALLADPAMRNALKIITLAPELPGASAAIAAMAAAGIVVSLGHTDADAAQIRAAAAAGANLVTHVFNAQSPLGHRAPGAAGIALTDPRLTPCLIADGVHVDPAILQLAFAACPRAVAVTDSILLAGLPPGTEAEFGGAPARLGQNGVGTRPDGTIAGAGITLDEGIRRLIAAGVPAEIAFAAATSRPADALGLADRGRIAPGARADLIWWGDDLTVRQVWRAGHVKPIAAAQSGTEAARAELMDLDERSTLGIVETFLAQEQAAQRALAVTAPNLAALADGVAARLQAGGRLFYVGAGTSGRLGLLDAVECGPTFGVGPDVIVPLLAGGAGAFIAAAECAEDDTQAAINALRDAAISTKDAVIGIAASGATPFTLAAIRHARDCGALTGAITNMPGSALGAAAELAVQIASGAEVIAGSTRLSAGTTQKIALNILSSTVMIRLGRVHGPFMVDMRATNAKLRARATRMTMRLSGAGEAAAHAALAAADMQIKVAVVMIVKDLAAPAARALLAREKGALRRALKGQS